MKTPETRFRMASPLYLTNSRPLIGHWSDGYRFANELRLPVDLSSIRISNFSRTRANAPGSKFLCLVLLIESIASTTGIGSQNQSSSSGATNTGGNQTIY